MKAFVSIPLTTGKSALLNVDHIEGCYEQRDDKVAIVLIPSNSEILLTSLTLEEIYDLIRKAQK